MNGAKPNDAHIALAEYHIPIITMNIDGLHKLAGSDALELHGGLPKDDEMDIAYSLFNNSVLYGDPHIKKPLINYERRKQQRDTEEMLDRISSFDERLLYVGITIVVKAGSMEELEERTEKVRIIGKTHNMDIVPHSYRQLDALNTSLPHLGFLIIGLSGTRNTKHHTVSIL